MIRLFVMACLIIAFATSAYAVPTFVSDGQYSHSSTSPLAATAPSGVSVGDLLVICAALQTSVAQGTLTTPVGFTSAGSTGAASDGGTGFVNLYLFYKVAVGADTSATSYNIAYNAGGTFGDITANVRDYTGTAASSPLDSSAFVVTPGDVLTNVVPALSSFTSGEIYVGCSASDVNIDSTTSSPAFSNVFNPGPFITRIYMGNYLPGSTPGTETYTYSNTTAGRTGWGATFKALGGAPPVSKLLPLQGVGP